MGNDYLVGGEGADSISGGVGFDAAVYDSAPTAVVASLNSPSVNTGDAAGDVYFSVESLVGSNFGDMLQGTGLSNGLNGFAGDDTLAGLAGADTLNGGDGIDRADYGSDAESVIVHLSDSSRNAGGARGDVLQGVENLNGTAEADTLVGDANANQLAGGDGGDSLDGGVGNDTTAGGFGDDTASGGIGSDSVTGGAGADEVFGGLGADTLDGGGGADTLRGGGGADALRGTDGDDDLYGDSGSDGLDGGDGHDELRGGSHADTLHGRSGADTLWGGEGRDQLSGGVGLDRFVYSAVGDSAPGLRDVILDFEGAGRAVGDVIDLSAIDARSTVSGNQAFSFAGTGAFTAAGQIRVAEVNGATLLRVNLDADLATAEFELLLQDGILAAATYTAADFVL